MGIAEVAKEQRKNRFAGCLIGLAAGDAVGASVEFMAPGTFEPVTDMTGGGPFGLEAGYWTDDTSMAICLAESLIDCGKFHPLDQMERYVKWFRHGYRSSTGTCFDIGSTCREALIRFEDSMQPFCGSLDPKKAGNGSLMRLAPVPMFYANNPARAMIASGDSSLTTHGAITAVDACRYFGGLIVGALHGADKEELLSDEYSPVPGFWKQHRLVPEIEEIALGSFKHRTPPAIQGSGYVVKSLEAALWAFHGSSSYREGCLLAANLGDDADTTAAIYGQLAGAYYGLEGIPEEWREKLYMSSYLIELSDRLFTASMQGAVDE
jgi:ADP-ribosyl-[dinitrogen reductase] hydrolase